MPLNNFALPIALPPEVLDYLIDHIAESVCKKMQAFQEINKEEKLLTSKEVCSKLGITAPTLNNYCNSDLITKYYIGKKVRFKESELQHALKTFKKYKVPSHKDHTM